MTETGRYSVDLTMVAQWTTFLRSFAQLDEDMIQNIWRMPDEPKLDGFSALRYEESGPIRPNYHTKLFRFWSAGRSPSAFWSALDPVSRDRLIFQYVFDSRNDTLRRLLDFFAWIKNGVCIAEFPDLIGDECATQQFSLVYQTNEINLFFFLSAESREKLVNYYNERFGNA